MFVLPEVQAGGLGRALLAKVMPAPGRRPSRPAPTAPSRSRTRCTRRSAWPRGCRSSVSSGCRSGMATCRGCRGDGSACPSRSSMAPRPRTSTTSSSRSTVPPPASATSRIMDWSVGGRTACCSSTAADTPVGYGYASSRPCGPVAVLDPDLLAPAVGHLYDDRPARRVRDLDARRSRRGDDRPAPGRVPDGRLPVPRLLGQADCRTSRATSRSRRACCNARRRGRGTFVGVSGSEGEHDLRRANDRARHRSTCASGSLRPDVAPRRAPGRRLVEAVTAPAAVGPDTGAYRDPEPLAGRPSALDPQPPARARPRPGRHRPGGTRPAGCHEGLSERQTALEEVDLLIPEGDFVFLVGPSGAGKSTLIKLLIRDELATHGAVVLDGQDLAKLPRRQVSKVRRRSSRVPGLQASAPEVGLGERRVRARGHGHAAQADSPGG